MSLLSRRALLKGIGTAVALPMLEAMAPLTALAQTVKRPNRMAFLFVPNGVNMDAWRPTTVGTGYQLTETLQPLSQVRGSVSVLTGLAQRNAFALGDGPGDHARSTAVWLTGVHPKKTEGSDISVGISVDQVAAQAIGSQTKFASLEIGCEKGAMSGNCDSGYSCAYSSSVSWRGPATPNAKEVSPRAVFERLFGNGKDFEETESKAKRDLYQKSVLDFVLDDAARLKGQLGERDQRKLDEYLSSVRDIEKRLTAFEGRQAQEVLAGVQIPAKGIPRDRGEHIRLLSDMMVLAFQTDMTRICTFMFANDGSNRAYPEIQISEGHHDISHHGKEDYKLEKKKKIDIFHVEQLAYLLEKMESIKEVDGSLLDNSMLVFGAGISDGDRHNHDDLPILLCGKGGGRLPAAGHFKFAPNTPMNNLFVTMLDKVGVDVETLGDSNGNLKELL
jgi:hypothetical protein